MSIFQFLTDPLHAYCQPTTKSLINKNKRLTSPHGSISPIPLVAQLQLKQISTVNKTSYQSTKQANRSPCSYSRKLM